MPLFTKIIYSMGAGSVSAGFYRVSLSLFTILIIQLLLKNKIKLSLKEFLVLLIPSISFIGTVISLYSSYNYIGSGLATSLHFLYPAIIFLFTIIMTRSKASSVEIICLFVSMISIFMLMGKNTSLDIRGVLLAIFSAFTYSIYSISLQNNNIKKINSFTILFYINLFASIILLIYSFIAKEKIFLPASFNDWVFIFLYSTILTIGAAFFYQKGVEFIGAKYTANLSILEPVVGVLSGIIFMRESASSLQMLAIVLILFSTLVLVNFSNKKESQKASNYWFLLKKPGLNFCIK